MKKQWGYALALLALAGMLASCGQNSTAKTKTSSSKQTTQKVSKQSAKSSAKAAKASLNKALAKAKKAGQKQQEHRYVLPQGPTWLKLYVDGKDSGIALDPTKTVVAKLSENQKINFVGKLPMVGKVSYGDFILNGSTTIEPTLDQAKVADKVINETVYFKSGSDHVLTVTDYKAIAARAFKDIPQYVAAHNTQDASKLPNQSESLQSALGDDTDGLGQPKNIYQLQQLCFDKHIDASEDSNEYLTYIALLADDGVNTASVNLYLAVWAKAKQTPSGIYKGDSAPKTVMVKYGMVYQFQNNQWVLSDVENKATDDHALKTTGNNWITQAE